MIFDRTQEDVDLKNTKGTYNIADLNRVNAKVQELSNLLNQLGYANLVEPKSWVINDIPSPAEMAKYLTDIETIREKIPVYNTTPELWDGTMDNLTFGRANDLEKILFDVEELLVKMQLAFMYSGEIYAGEV